VRLACLIVLTGGIGLLAACSPDPAGDASVAPMNQVEANAVTAVVPAPGPVVPEAAPIRPGDILPLTRGVYVLAGTPCADPPNAALLVFDGRGISGSATRDCHTRPIKARGRSLQIDQSCADVTAGERKTERQVIELQGLEAFWLKTPHGRGAYRLCRELDPAAFGTPG